jgi:hypothetical protein
MIKGSCHCGAVTLEVPQAPARLTSCNCSICRRVGGLWGYYRPDEVTAAGQTVTYVWGDRMLALHHCGTCGCITHWTPLDPAGNRMGVNARMLDLDLAPIPVTRLDGADTWTVLED